MLSSKMAERLNQHLNVELYSGYLYLAMSAYCKSESMNGFANWFFVQAQEETAHALKFYNYINDQSQPVTLFQIDQPPTKFSSFVEVFEKSLSHEQHVTSCINELLTCSLQEKDHATHAFLEWFITEQVEEEASVKDILDSVKRVKDSGQGLLMLDRELATRKFTAPAEETA